MQFNSFNEFLNMGGYAFYVWLSYGVTAALLIFLLIASLHKNKTVKKQILARQKRENKLRIAAEQQKELSEKHNDSNEVLS